MSKIGFDLSQNLNSIRKQFPILDKCTYLISNSLGAVPRGVQDELQEFFRLWAEEGVSAWEKEWWELPGKIAGSIASLLGAESSEITMMPNATQCHWVALSTQFKKQEGSRNKIIMTDHDFPSSLYAVSQIAKFMDWEIDIIPSFGKPGIEPNEIKKWIDRKTLFVATSHVYFKSSYVQDIAEIASYTREQGAFSLIDGYHAPGSIPISLKELGVDFYIGGCLKWLCGGPGNAFLYSRSELHPILKPMLTGWFAHRQPFVFDIEMDYTEGSYRFMSGTPPIPSFYTAATGLNIIKEVGLSQIRNKSLAQTEAILKNSENRGFQTFTPKSPQRRGGAVSIALPHAFQIKQFLNTKEIKVDFRKGKLNEPDIIRVGPHFYTTDEEIEILFQEIDKAFSTKDYKKFPSEPTSVT
jgi:kynureninase